MATEKRKARVPMPVRWAIEEWAFLLEVAHSIGTTRSEFVRTAALNAARATQSLLPSYSVDVAKATPQNTRINLFPGEAGTKLDTGGGQDAAPRLRSNGEAKGGTTSDLQAHRLRRAVSRKS